MITTSRLVQSSSQNSGFSCFPHGLLFKFPEAWGTGDSSWRLEHKIGGGGRRAGDWRARARLSHHSVTPTFVQTHSSCPVNIPMNAETTGFVCNFGNSYTKLQFKKFQLFFKCWFKIVALEEGGKKLQKYSNIIHRT